MAAPNFEVSANFLHGIIWLEESAGALVKQRGRGGGSDLRLQIFRKLGQKSWKCRAMSRDPSRTKLYKRIERRTMKKREAKNRGRKRKKLGTLKDPESRLRIDAPPVMFAS